MLFRSVLPLLLCLLAFSHQAPVHAAKPSSESGGTASPIVNGTPASDKASDWMASLVRKNPAERALSDRHFCGGSLIGSTWILTAAHCVSGADPSGFQAVVGTTDLDSGEGEIADISQIIVHPYYSDTTFGFDLALLRLAAPVSREGLGVPDEPREENFYNQELTVYGWGGVRWNDDQDCEVDEAVGIDDPTRLACHTRVFEPVVRTVELQQTALYLATEEECFQRLLVLLGEDEDTTDLEPGAYPVTLCAWDPSESTAACYGDSGGPLVGELNGRLYVVGVVSGGMLPGCPLEGQISVFTRVAAFWWYIIDMMSSDESLLFDKLCPGSIRPEVSYEELGGGQSRATVSWALDERAETYRLYYSANPVKNGFVGRFELAGTASGFSRVLESGSRYIVSVQAGSSDCDGPMSALVSVDVP